MPDFEKLAKKFDKSKMLEKLDGFPEQAMEGWRLGKSFRVPEALSGKKFDKIFFLGMGGSGIAGMIAKSLLEKKCPIPAFLAGTYSLPGFADKNSLAIALSYSGNTEETLACAKDAEEKGIAVIGITSGGLLGRENRHNVIVPRGFPPRTATGYTLFALLAVLENLGIANFGPDAENAIGLARKKREQFRKRGQQIAQKLFKKIPAIYSSDCLEPIAYRWHTQLAENSKTFSHWAVLPELNHNEIVGYGPFEEKLCFVLLRSGNENARMTERLDLTKRICAKKSVVEEVLGGGETSLERKISLMLIGDYASYYLALLNAADPTPVENISFLKKSIKEKGFF